GYSPDGKSVVLGSGRFQRSCYAATCSLYILDTALDARLIASGEAVSKGLWFPDNGFIAKDPVWSPAGNWIAFVSNHEADAGCIDSPNIFVGQPTQNPTIRRLTTGSDFCAGGNTGHPSFSPNGSNLAFWNQGTGLKQIYI